MRKKFTQHKLITKDEICPPKVQESDTAKQELVKPDCLAPATNENGMKNEISVFIPETSRDDLSHQLLDNEKAVDDGGIIKRENMIWDKMSPSPIWRMGQLENVLDGNLFAQIIEDKNGFRSVSFCQRYQDGSLSPKMMVSQADIIMAALYIRSKQNGNNTDKSLERRVSKFKTDLLNEYLGKFRGGPEDAYNIVDIINALHRALPLLPICSDDITEQKRRELYREIVEKVDIYLSQRICKIEGYYALLEEDMIFLAQEMKRDKLSLLREMRDYGFLYIQSSASGFQSNVRLKRSDGSTYTGWRYCIYKIQYFTGESNGTDNDDPFDF